MSAASTLPAPDLDAHADTERCPSRDSDPDVAVAWSKLCTVCGVIFSRAEWDALPYVGRQDDGEGADLEYRNHHCACLHGDAATLTITVPKGGL